MANETKWLAAYLYYGEPWEKMLTEAVKPFVEKIMSENLADQYFFIRYWEKGPHIRLRFKGDIEILESKVKPRLTAHFEAYFKSNPSERNEPEWLKTAESEHQWYPNNSIQFIDYEPETERYGGPVAITVAEEQFQASSDAVLAVIGESVDSWEYDRALGAAIQMHLGFSYGLGMSLKEMQSFFEMVFESWLPRAYYFFEKEITQEELDRRKKETLEAFALNFENQKESLLPFFKTVWGAMNQNQEFEQEWLNNWIDQMSGIGEKILQIQTEHALIPPKRHQKIEHTGFSDMQHDRWLIYDSYVHMINNRLGIMNRDEGYLGYLIKESIAEMLSSETSPQS